MKQPMRSKILIIFALVAGLLMPQVATAQSAAASTKKERNHISSGNKLYNEKRYAEAEVEYRKALQENPMSYVAAFNLATTMLRQGNGTAAVDDEKNPANKAMQELQKLAETCPDKNLVAKACYDLGNIAYSRQEYDQAIELYKNALRRNPADNQARTNLRLAQLKKKEQEQQKQDQKNNQNKDNQDNKDKNKDKDKDKNQDQNQDKNKDKKDNGQDQDKNKDKGKDEKGKENPADQKNGQQGNGNPQKGDQGNKQQSQQGGMSKQSMEQILKTMQDKENATQQRVQAVQAKQQQRERARTSNKW